MTSFEYLLAAGAIAISFHHVRKYERRTSVALAALKAYSDILVELHQRGAVFTAAQKAVMDEHVQALKKEIGK